ncbi:MAG: chemotaxis protein CheA [Firmicutes bacterium]|jgi:two-component system chemotaxis sensor kinase CheA|nr:chemotaxis protein CheA [Bacillota bacterium]NBI63785.1 chemotaxis protein CheA [Clostridiales bacterium]
MDNGTGSLLETYLFETGTLLEQLDELLITAEQNGDFTEDNVNEIFRSMHTIKGSSAMLEFNSLMEIAHHIEDLFFYIRDNGMDTLTSDQKSELFNLMFSSVDKLREEVGKVESSEPLDTNIDGFIQDINNFLNKISNKDSGAAAESAVEAPAANGTDAASHPIDAPYALQIFFDEGCGMENLRAFMLVTALQEIGKPFNFYPDDVETNSESSEYIIENGFFLGFQTEEDAESAVAHVSTVGNVRSYEILDLTAAQKTEEVPPQPEPAQSAPPEAPVQPVPKKAPAPEKDKKPASQSSGSHGSAKQSLISVNLSKLDSLMAIVGEIVITESMVTSSPELQNLKLDSFLKSARQLRKLTDDLQDISMSLRMVSVASVFQKMNRIVRDMSKTLKRDTKLTIIGENTEVDKTIVDNIGDPIMHIVRNAMDHGIEETQEERIAAGKNPQGEIILSAEHTGSEVIISIKDDGRGVNPDAVLAKAAAQGLLTKPEEEYSQKEILALLLAPGFSTNTEVTEYSGRGVGMDVVKKNVESVGGVISISSELGKGSCFTLKIPLTLAIVDGMEISVGDSIFTIPIANIRQSFKAKESDVVLDAAGNEMIRCMDDYYPIIRLRDLYAMEEGCSTIDDGILMWVESSDKSYCLFVDELIGEQQIVVKPLPSYLNNFNIQNSGISGCTILGDGNISLILDVNNVYSASQNMFF